MSKRIVVDFQDGTTQEFEGDEVSAERDEHTGVLKVRNGYTELGVFQPGEFSEFRNASA